MAEIGNKLANHEKRDFGINNKKLELILSEREKLTELIDAHKEASKFPDKRTSIVIKLKEKSDKIIDRRIERIGTYYDKKSKQILDSSLATIKTNISTNRDEQINRQLKTIRDIQVRRYDVIRERIDKHSKIDNKLTSARQSKAFTQGQDVAKNRPNVMYDNPHHPSTEQFGEYNRGWTTERFGQNEKDLSAVNNEKLSLTERLTAYDSLAKDVIRENDGKTYVRTLDGKSELGERPVPIEAIADKKNKFTEKNSTGNDLSRRNTGLAHHEKLYKKEPPNIIKGKHDKPQSPEVSEKAMTSQQQPEESNKKPANKMDKLLADHEALVKQSIEMGTDNKNDGQVNPQSPKEINKQNAKDSESRKVPEKVSGSAKSSLDVQERYKAGALQEYKEAFKESLEMRRDFSDKPGYIRQKDSIEKAYHSAKKEFGEFNLSDMPGMEANTNNGKGATINLPDGGLVKIENQLQLFNKIIEINKSKGKFYDEQYIKDNNPNDLARLKASGKRLINAKESIVRVHEDKQQARQAIQDTEKDVLQTSRTNKSEYKETVDTRQPESEIERVGEVDPQRRKAPDPEYTGQYVADSKGRYYEKSNPEKVVFRAKETKITTKAQDGKTAAAMVAVADAKGWESMKVSGTQEFRREVWMEAESRGIEVSGYKPTEIDLKQLDERRNTIEKTDAKASDLKKAMETKPRSEVIKDNPKMAGVYLTQDEMTKFIQDNVKDKKQHEPMIKAGVDLAIKQAAAGKEVAKMKEAVKTPEKEVELER